MTFTGLHAVRRNGFCEIWGPELRLPLLLLLMHQVLPRLLLLLLLLLLQLQLMLLLLLLLLLQLLLLLLLSLWGWGHLNIEGPTPRRLTEWGPFTCCGCCCCCCCCHSSCCCCICCCCCCCCCGCGEGRSCEWGGGLNNEAPSPQKVP